MTKNLGKAHVFCYVDGKLLLKYSEVFSLEVERSLLELQLSAKLGFQTVICCKVSKETECAQAGKHCFMISTGDESLVFKFADEQDARHLSDLVKDLKSSSAVSVFHERTEESSATQYFQFYAYLSQQQNMMQDYVRTSTYQRAILSNLEDFRDKVVLDVGAGSGILSFFAVQAGARRVYAVEASSMVQHCNNLIKSNRLENKIECVYGKIEEIQLPEKVDVIISEPMGYMLYNERMLETYLHAKKWLKPGGRMFPTTGDLYIAPFCDYQLHMEQYQKANFWCQDSFHGVDLTCLRDEAVAECFRQPIVDTFHMDVCMSDALQHPLNFEQVDESDLHLIDIPLQFQISKTGHVHGLAFWFNVTFRGSKETIVLSTAPTEALTHWYQVRCLLPTPVFAQAGVTLKGTCVLKANTRQSYDVELSIRVPGEDGVSTNTLDLKNPFFRYSGQAPVQPPGNHTGDASPTDRYWASTQMVGDPLDDIVMLQQQQQQVATVTQQLAAVSMDYQASSLGKVLPMAGPPGSQSAPIHPGCIPALGTYTAAQKTQSPHQVFTSQQLGSPAVSGNTFHLSG